ncbi:MAG: PAS domain-containing protein [Candidatus Binatia bacterium]
MATRPAAEDLSRTNDDMQNLLNNTEVATLFLDNELKIKRYTEPARQLIHVIQTDIGRPLAHLASSLAYEKLVGDCREVLRTLVFKLAEVRSKEGRRYLMRIMLTAPPTTSSTASSSPSSTSARSRQRKSRCCGCPRCSSTAPSQ